MLRNNIEEHLELSKNRYDKLCIMEKVIDIHNLDKNIRRKFYLKYAFDTEVKEIYELSLLAEDTSGLCYEEIEFIMDKYFDKVSFLSIEKDYVYKFYEMMKNFYELLTYIKDSYFIEKIHYKKTILEKLFNKNPQITLYSIYITVSKNWKEHNIMLSYDLKDKRCHEYLEVSKTIDELLEKIN